MKLLRLFVILSATVALRAEPEYPKMGPDIYDPKADGASQLADAIVQAAQTHKRIVLDLGANWCIWCRRLKSAFEADPAVKQALDENFLLLLVDVNHRDNKSRNDIVIRHFDDPLKEGLPVLLVLEKDGRQLTILDTSALENGKDGYDSKKILAFLEKWEAKK